MSDKRNSNGTFAKGNKGGTGNPYARKTASLRNLFYETATDEDMKVIIQRLVADAKDGDPVARKELFNRMIGKPVDSPHPDELDQHEATIEADRIAAERRAESEERDRRIFDNILSDF